MEELKAMVLKPHMEIMFEFTKGNKIMDLHDVQGNCIYFPGKAKKRIVVSTLMRGQG